MLIIERVILYDDLCILFSQWPIEQPQHPIDEDAHAEIQHESEDDRTDEILEGHVDLK
jgi:hypothetical protein